MVVRLTTAESRYGAWIACWASHAICRNSCRYWRQRRCRMCILIDSEIHYNRRSLFYVASPFIRFIFPPERGGADPQRPGGSRFIIADQPHNRPDVFRLDIRKLPGQRARQLALARRRMNDVGGQMLGPDQTIRGENGCPLNRILQLANIARPADRLEDNPRRSNRAGGFEFSACARIEG